MRPLSLLGFLLAVIAVAALLEGCDDPEVCPAVDPVALAAALPERLSETGLAAAEPFTPAFELWSDGAEKRRFIALPEGAVIDSRDMDDWRFPEGTTLWKELARDGVIVETRLMLKAGPAEEDWRFAAYLHDRDDPADASRALLTAEAVEDANGTGHDVPAADRCLGCHGGRAGRVLGYSAVQLAGEQLDGLVARGLLSDPPRAPVVVPGDDVARRAVGYLHANCAHCHNAARPAGAEGARCFDPRRPFDFTIPAGAADVDELPALRTAFGSASDGLPFARGDVRESYGLLLMGLRTENGRGAQMPPLATELVDDDGVAIVRAFVESL